MKDETDREIAIFTEAAQLSPKERDVFLQGRCGWDEHLRRKMEALLKAHDRLGNFLEKPAQKRRF